MQRKSEILLCARRQFAARGFHGASLRTIASDAHVSLTLLNHHFGSKAGLLSAVDAACAGTSEERTAELHRVMKDGRVSYSSAQILETWLRSDFAVAAQVDGDSLLRFISRIAGDDEVESRAITDRVDIAGDVLIDGLQACFPQASRRPAASAFLFASGASTHFLLNAGRVFGRSEFRETARQLKADEEHLLRCVVVGVEAALMGAETGVRASR